MHAPSLPGDLSNLGVLILSQQAGARLVIPARTILARSVRALPLASERHVEICRLDPGAAGAGIICELAKNDPLENVVAINAHETQATPRILPALKTLACTGGQKFFCRAQ